MKSLIFYIKPEKLGILTNFLLKTASPRNHLTFRNPEPPEEVIPDHVRIDLNGCADEKVELARSFIVDQGGTCLSVHTLT